MPPHQVSEASEAHVAKIGVRTPTRPRLVSANSGGLHEVRVESLRTREAFGAGGHRVMQPQGQSWAFSLPQTAPPHVRVAQVSSARAVLKRVFDIVGALLLGVVFAPLMMVIALLLRREGGPIIYRHRRIGRDGQVFECLKFRSMVPNADRVLRDLLERRPDLKVEWVRDHKLRGDPRVTRLGHLLRRTSLDELPQIWNVLRGEMSLVGPRPVVREELMRYGRSIPIYLSAKPGITGLWQVTGRNDTSYRRRVALDVYYVRRQNLLLDLYILLKTTRVVLGGGGAY